MDDKDRLLVAALRKDGRRTLVALARDLGLSRSATQERLDRLLRTGVIRGFTTVEEDRRRGGACAHFLLRHRPGRTCAQLVPKLHRVPGIVSLHSVAGAIDMVIQAEGTDTAAIEAIRAAIVELPEVAEVTTLMVLERFLD
ncbi:Lrp/AsnC family transcriptional regulator [Azospirillum picis]|uniref:DNA-binding Lrp family transcriptional regulator n=1 Tax=Azospirillum picis TaxID=488438 RepID=A0ABU0MHN3_9PROT|nr:Lrp/AsnC family transcriptional regulator [Azospirillum picis]MBP2299397.1 DNA-binding Lrp family transcriptional regulator [Azospirillum picis]MDQ0532965.1 DNA-binding Lrp family transcriptional regulator [Azospirillum picis]